MPRYVYQCEGCERTFQAIHSISEKFQSCKECDIECNLSGTLKRIPCMPLVISKKERKQKPGGVVNQFIEQTREELRQEKKTLKGKDFKK